MTPLALSVDALAALAVAAAAATFLVVRVVRFFRAGARGACACPTASSCGKGGRPSTTCGPRPPGGPPA